jgi:hypothetical protein
VLLSGSWLNLAQRPLKIGHAFETASSSCRLVGSLKFGRRSTYTAATQESLSYRAVRARQTILESTRPVEIKLDRCIEFRSFCTARTPYLPCSVDNAN